MNVNPDRSVSLLVRLALVALGLPNVVAGAWAVLAPEAWYRDFPGLDPRLVAAEPPFNAHLATDAGAGLLASGVVLIAAAWLADARTVRLALVAFTAFAVPHAIYHVLNPAPGLTGGQDVVNAASLTVAALAPAALWWVVAHGPRLGRAPQFQPDGA